MQNEVIQGMTFMVKEGTIEYSNGAAVPMIGFSTKVLGFDDGETVQNVVVDTTIERYATPGCSGRFAFVKKNKFLQLVGVETPDKGLQIGNVMLAGAGSGWARAMGIGAIIVGLPLSLIIVGIPILLVGIAMLVMANSYSRPKRAMMVLQAAGAIPGTPSRNPSAPLAQAA